MIYLIGGPPRCGKTTLAESLAKKISFPYFTLDHVTSVVSPYIPESEYVTRLPLRVAREETNYSNDVFYARYSTEQIVNIYFAQAGTYWPGIENFIKYAIEDDHDLILEGWQILPHFVHAMVTPENQNKLKIIFLYKTNVENIVCGLKANTAGNDWVLKNTKDENTFSAIARMISHFGSHIEKEAKQNDLRSVNTDKDFRQKLDESLESMVHMNENR